MSLLLLGTQSLQANQSALAVTGQNISNVNTEGYSRQRPVFESREGRAGVVLEDVDRIADAFLNRQIWTDSATFSSYDAFEDFANELDNLLASDVTSVSKAMDDYFGALQTAVDDPVSLPNRELFIAQTEALVQRFNDLDANIRRQNDTINGRLESNVAAINVISANIAQLNQDIAVAQASGNVNSELLDKRDAELEELSTYIGFTTIEQPTGEVSVFVGNGEPLVVGLSANQMTTLFSPADSSQLNIGLQIGNSVGDITNQLSGGKIGGVIDYRDDILGDTLDEMGRIALVLAETMNSQHQKGMDLNGAQGGLIFTDINSASAVSSRVLSARDNATLVSAGITINDVTALEAAEYSLEFNDNNTFTLVRGDDEQRWSNSNISLTQVTSASDVDQDGEYFLDTVSGDMTLRVDGFTLTMSTPGAFATGDQFILRPTRNAASEISTEINIASQLALAAPLATSASAENTGTGTISVSITDKDYSDLSAVPGAMTPPVNVSFSPLATAPGSINSTNDIEARVTNSADLANVQFPVTVTYTAGAPGTYAVVDNGGTTLIAAGVADGNNQVNVPGYGLLLDVNTVPQNGETYQISHMSDTGVMSYVLTDGDGDRMVGDYTSGQSIQLSGYEITINNNPNVNDKFTVNPNTGGVSDNRNALLMSDLQSAKLIEGASYQDKYGQTVERVGTQAAVAQVNAQAGKSVLDSNKELRASIAGVNLDEEAAKLVQYQQAYQASAQLIRAAQTIFDSLLQSV